MQQRGHIFFKSDRIAVNHRPFATVMAHLSVLAKGQGQSSAAALGDWMTGPFIAAEKKSRQCAGCSASKTSTIVQTTEGSIKRCKRAGSFTSSTPPCNCSKVGVDTTIERV